jgi:hypothetical protein
MEVIMPTTPAKPLTTATVIRLDDRRPTPRNPTVAELRAWGRIEAPAPRKIEMLGLMPDGRLVLWSYDWMVPMRTFPMEDGRIASDQFIIEWKGQPVAAHLSHSIDESSVGVTFMGGDVKQRLKRDDVEARLLGRVGTDESRQALRALMQEVLTSLRESHNAPHLQRGRIAQ